MQGRWGPAWRGGFAAMAFSLPVCLLQLFRLSLAELRAARSRPWRVVGGEEQRAAGGNGRRCCSARTGLE